MKCIRNIVAILLVAVFTLTLLPMSTLAEATQPYEKVEHPEPGVTAYYNKDGTITYDIELTQGADGSIMTLAEAEPEKDTLSDAGAYLVGADDAVRVQIKKEFEEGQTLVTVGANGTSVSFYPVIQDIAVEQPEESEIAPETTLSEEAPQEDIPTVSQQIESGTVTAFVGYTEKPERKPLDTIMVPMETERSELALPKTIKVLLEGTEHPFALPVKRWMEFEGIFGDELGQWRFQPEWDLVAFPLSETLQAAILGDPDEIEDDDPFVIPFILVTLTEDAEETPEPSESPEPSDSPEPETSAEPGGSEPSTPEAAETPLPQETPVPEEPVQQGAEPPQAEEAPVAEGENVLTALRPNGGYTIGRLTAVRHDVQEPGAPLETEAPAATQEPAAPTETSKPIYPAETPIVEPKTSAEPDTTPESVQATPNPSAGPTAEPEGEKETPLPSAQPEERGLVSATGRRRGQSAVLYQDVFEEGTDIKLSALTTGVKEDIVIGAYTGNHVFAYRMNFHGLTPVQNGGEIQLYHMNQQQGVVHAPYMTDANGKTSTDIAVDFTSLGGNEYELTYTPSDDWLSAEERAYPVTIDPWLDYWNGSPDGSAGSAYGTYVNTASPDSNYGTSGTLYAGGTCTTLVQPLFSSAITAYANRMLIQASYLKAGIYGGNPGTTNMYPALGGWGTGTVTANTMPTLGAGENAGWTSSLSAWNITPIVASWFNAISQRSNNGLALANLGGETVSMSNSFVLSLTVYRVDEAKSLTATTAANGDGTGNVNLSWTAIGEATGYYVGIYNGKNWQYLDVGNVTSWSTGGKGIWPTEAEIAAGRYELHLDGSGANLPASPAATYRNANASNNSIAYQFCLLPGGYYGQAVNPWSPVTAIMPHALKPAQPSSVQVSPSTWTKGNIVNVSWAGIVDYLADGSQLTTLEPGGKIEYSVDGISNWQNTGKNTASGTYTLDITGLTDRTHAVYLRGKDKDGNEGAPLGASFKIDRTAPTTPTVTIVPDDWTNGSSVTLDWSGITEPLSGIARVEYSVDSGVWTDTGSVLAADSISLPISTYTNGTHTVSVRAADVAGNVGTAGSATFKKDTAAPAVASFAASPASWTDADTVSVAWTNLTDAHSGLAALSYSVDGGAYATLDHMQTNGSVNIDASGMLDGTHTVDFRYMDNAGNTGTQAVSFYRDTTAPTVSISQPAAGDLVNGIVNITGTVNDAQAMGSWTLTAAGTSGVTVVAAGTGNVNGALLGVLNTGTFADGEEITLTLTATDVAGHIATTTGVVVKVDKSMTDVPGTITVTAPTDGTVISTATATGAYTGGSANGAVYIDGTEVQTASGRGFVFHAIRYPEGSSHTFTVIATKSDGTLEYSQGLGALVIGSDAPETSTGMVNSGTLTAPKNILALRLTTTQSAATGITYEYSADGGTTWNPIAPGKDVRLTAETNSVQLKATLDGSATLHGWELAAIVEKSPVSATVQLNKPVVPFTITQNGPLTTAPETAISTDLTATGITDSLLYADGTLVNDTAFAYETLLTAENGSVTLTALALDDTNNTLYGSGNVAVLTLKRENVSSSVLTVQTGALTAAQPIYAIRLLAETAGNGCKFYASVDNATWTQINPGEYVFLEESGTSVYFKAEQTTANQLLAWHIEGVTATGKNLTVQLVNPPTNLVARDYGKHSDKRYELSWTPAAGADASTAYVIRKNGVEIGTTTATTYTDNAYVSGAAYTVSTKKTFPAPDSDPLHTHYLVRESAKINARKIVEAAPASGGSGTVNNPLIDFSDVDTLRKLYGDTYLFTRDMLTPPETDQLDQKLLGDAPYCSLGFEPVNFNTGNFFLETRDYSQTDIGLTLDVLRSYNAQSSVEDSPFGAKWEFPYSQKLELYADGNIGYRAADGALTVFTLGDSGKYKGNDDEHLTLAADRDAQEYRVIQKNGTAYVFSMNLGWLLRTEDKNGNAIRMERGENGYLSAIVAESGARLTLTMDKAGHITEIALPDGGKLLYAYKGDNLVSFTDQLGNVIKYVYDRAGRMTEWYDAADTRQVKNTYDKDGRVIHQLDGQGGAYSLVYGDDYTFVTDALGQKSEIWFDSLRRTIQEVDARGNTVEYFYDANGNLSGTTDALNKLTSSEYDERGNQVKNILPDGSTGTKAYDERDNLLSFTDANGNVTAYSYDEHDNLLTATDPTGGVTKYAYNEMGQLVETTDPTGNTTTYAYAGANLDTVTDALGNQTRYEYDRSGRVLASTDALGNTTRYAYDKLGNLLSLAFADGTAIAYTYDALGNRTSMTDPMGNTTTYTYDALYRQTAVTYADGTTETVEYDFNSKPVKVTDVLGNVTTAEYDTAGNRISVIDPLGNTTKFAYDKMNRLVKETLPTGATITYTYNAETGLVTDTTNEAGVTTKLTYDKTGNLLTQTLPNGAVTTTEYDAANRAVRQTDALGNSVALAYDTAGRLSAVTNALGGVTTYAYDALGNLVSTTDALGNVAKTAYDPLGRVISTTDARGAVTSYAYDSVGNLVSVTDALGNTEAYDYDKNGSLTKLTDPLGHDMTFAYDALGSMVKAVQKNGATVGTEYDAAGRVLSETDALGNETTYAYNALGLVTEITDPLGQQALISYDKLGNIEMLTGPDGAITRYAYECSGRLLSTTDPRGTKTAYEYDDVSNITAVTTHESTTTYEYDLGGNVTAMTDAEGRTVRFEYDAAGNLLKTIYPDETFATMEYDLLGRLVKETPRRGIATTYEYDGNGNLVTATTGAKVTRMEYDALGNLVKTTYPDGTAETMAYDALGNLSTSTDALDNATGFAYDASSLLTAVTYANGAKLGLAYDKAGNLLSETDAEGAKQTYAYDAVGRMTAVTDALGAVTRFAYDATDNLTKVTDALGHATTYAYDKGGNLVSETDALGNTVRYAYTPEGWLSTITKADGTAISYEYDKTGNVTRESASDGTVTNHEYNQIGELVTTESDEGVTKYQYNSKGYLAYVVNPGGEVVSYTYDDYGRKVALKYPDGKVVSYTYDEMDRMTGVTGLDGDTTAYTYDAAGRRVSTSNSTLTTTYAYDPVGNLTKQETNGKAEISFEYVYNLNNAITEETRVENGASVKSQYTYDKLGQLTSFVKSDGHEETYAYDKMGNMLEKVLNSTKIAMTYDAANELRTMESVGGKIDYSYDANGNLTSKMLGTKTDTYTYVSYNQLTSYKGYDGYQQRYTYNASGHMIKKESKGNDQRQTLEEIVRGDEKKAASDDGGDDDPDPYADKSASDSWQVTTYIYDVTAPYYEVLAETTDGVTTTYDYGVERLAAHTASFWGSSKTEYVYDGRGSVAQEVSYNNSWYTFGGKIGKASVVSKSYSPFGELLNKENIGSTINYAFNGEAYDPATGMVNLRARQYEPALTRFSQRDILKGDLSIPLSLNRYLYCANDPVNFADFDGQSLKSLWNKAKSAVSSAAKAVTKAVTTAAKAVAKTVTNTARTVAKAVTSVAQTVAKTVTSVTKAVGSAISSAATAVKNAVATTGNGNNGQSSGNGYVSTEMLRQTGTVAENIDISQTSAIQDMLGHKAATPEQEPIIRQAQAELDALYNSGAEVTQQQIDSIIATACTKLIDSQNTDSLNLHDNNGNLQATIPAYTEAIDSLYERKDKEFGSMEKVSSLYLAPFVNPLTNPKIAIIQFPATSTALEFYNQVKTGGEMDVKLERNWVKSITDYSPEAQYLGNDGKFVYNGELLSAEMLGNRTYGYLGTEVGFTPTTLYIGGGWAKTKEINLDPNQYYGDDANDHVQIEIGIQQYMGK